MPESNTPSNSLPDRLLQVEVVNHTEQSIDVRQLQLAVRHVLRQFRVLRSAIQIAVVDDATIARVHREHMGIDEPTDVITFPLSDAAEPRLEGDILISVETAAREADARGLTAHGELTLYAVHGALHLVGLDDTTPQLAETMRQWERTILDALHLPYRFDGISADAEPRP